MPDPPERNFQQLATAACLTAAFLLPGLFVNSEDPLGSAALAGLTFSGLMGFALLIAVSMSRPAARLKTLSASGQRLGRLPLYVLAGAMALFALILLARMAAG